MYSIRRVPRNDVGGLPAVGDDAVHHVAGLHLLAQQADGHLRDGDGVGGIEPQIRRDGGVRFAARVADRHLRERQRPRAGDVERTGVQHHRGGDVVERTGVEQQHLSATRLLGGRAEQYDGEAELVGDLRQRQRRADRRCRNDVVPARVSDARERVVLRADPDDQRPASVARPERGIQSAGSGGDLEAAFRDQRLRLCAAAVFVEGEFRIGVNRVRQLDQVATPAHNRLLDGGGRGGDGHPRSISPSAGAFPLASGALPDTFPLR